MACARAPLEPGKKNRPTQRVLGTGCNAASVSVARWGVFTLHRISLVLKINYPLAKLLFDL